MAQRIIATFSGRDVRAFPGFQALLPAMLPFFNAIAGETVYVEDRGEDVLILASAKPDVDEALPDFRAFFTERQHSRWPAKIGETYDHSFVRLAEALADYADEIRKRSGC